MAEEITYSIRFAMLYDHKEPVLYNCNEYIKTLGFKPSNQENHIVTRLTSINRSFKALNGDISVFRLLSRKLWDQHFPHEIVFIDYHQNPFIFEQRFLSPNLQAIYKSYGLSNLTLVNGAISNKDILCYWTQQMKLLKEYKTLQLLKEES